nr:probable mitochondrial-processing peptidase subunit beta, mitochondrial [Ipomoea batatas]
MATRHLLSFTRRSRTLAPSCLSQSTRSASQSLAQASEAPVPASPPPPEFMIYDRLAEGVKSKLKRLGRPDLRFLKYNSPHPVETNHASILSAPETKVTTLPNGLRVATESNLAAKTATVGVWIDAGSRFETDENNGVAHFLEHMIFKGTDKRTQRTLEEEIENMGGHLNAYTSREMTTYYAKVQSKDVPQALDLLSDILQNSKFEQGNIDRERNVILREMEEVEGHPEEVIFDQLHATAFQYTPLGRTILGPVENINKITKEDIQDYISTHYAPHRMPDCLDDLAYAIMYEISKLCYRVSEADVIRARNQLKSSLMLHIDGPSPAAEDIGRQLITYGRRMPYAELFARIDAVDANTIKRVANRFIFDRDVAISARGPIQGLLDYNWFRRRTYWLRY